MRQHQFCIRWPALSHSALLPLTLLGTMLMFPVTAAAHETDDRPFIQPGATGEAIRPQTPDGELRGILRQIDQHRLEQTVRTLVNFGTRHTLSSQTDPVRGIGAATQFVFAQLQTSAVASGGRMTVQQQTFVQPVSPRVPVPTVITNVVATITGSNSRARVYVVSANLDSRVTDILNFTSDAPGADSNASGVAVILELARVFAMHQPKATIVLTTVAGKNQGLFGSAFQAAQFRAAGTDVEAMFSVERVGSSTAQDGTRDRHTLRLFTEGVPTAETPNQGAIRQVFGGEVDGVSRELGRFTISVADNEQTDMRIRHIYRRDDVLRASDQVSYLTQGYTAARFAEPHENFNHENTDTTIVNGVQFGDLVDFLDFEFLARAAKVSAATVWSLTQGPAAPKNAFIRSQTLSNDADLSWDVGAEPDLAGYQVVWRETTDADWTHFIPVGNVTTAHIPLLSRDNVFFGVRAVDTAGHLSPVAFAEPN